VSNPSQNDPNAGFGKSPGKSSFDRPLFGMVAAALTAASVMTLTPTAASAFSIEGAIAGAIASRLGGGGYHHSYGGGRSARHSAPSHSYAKGDSGSGSSKSGDEKDARDEDSGNVQPVSGKTTVRPQPGGPVREASQSAQNDAPAKTQDDELTFKPSR
jgi:hypothetical protein